jgi:hypothetical protein
MDLGLWQPVCTRPSGLVVPVPVDPTGRAGPTRGMAAGPHFRQTSPGRFVAAEVDNSVVEQRILEQSRRLREYGAVTSWACLRWRGAHFFTGLDVDGHRLPVPLVLGESHLRPDDRVAISQEQLAPHEFEWVADVRCTTVARTLFDEVRRVGSWSVREAVVAVDMTSAAGLVRVAQMALYVATRSSWTGVPLARQVLVLAADGSRSPQETRMRLCWVIDAGFPTPLCNRPVYDLHGRLLGVPDILDPVAGVVGEYDGDDHKRGERHRRDVAREALFRDHGLEYFSVVGGDLRDRALVAARMRNARARARFLEPDACPWTLTPPYVAKAG